MSDTLIQDDKYSDIDYQIINFLNKYTLDSNIIKVPTPTSLRVSTRSAICKITKHINVDKMVSILYYNIIKNLEEKNNLEYPIIGLKYRNIDINYNDLKKKNKSKKKKKNFYNQVTLIIKPHPTIRPQNIKLFRNSSISMTGGKDQFDGLCAVITLLYELKKYPSIFLTEEDRHNITYKDFKITLINSDYSLEYKIDRLKLYELLINQYKMFVVYSPDIYSGVKIYFFWNDKNIIQDGICRCKDKCYAKKKFNKDKKFGCKRVTIAVFQSGKIIITGANKINQTNNAYKLINKIIADNYNALKRLTIQDCCTDSIDQKNDNSNKKIVIKIKKYIKNFKN
jgi:hypothetical protein